MAELVDALVSGTSGASRGGSSPLLGTSTIFLSISRNLLEKGTDPSVQRRLEKLAMETAARSTFGPREGRGRIAHVARHHSVRRLGARNPHWRQQHYAVPHPSSRARSYGLADRSRYRHRRSRRNARALPQPHRDHQGGAGPDAEIAGPATHRRDPDR